MTVQIYIESNDCTQIKHVYSSLMASLSKKSVYFEIFKFEIKGNLIFYISRSKRFKLSTRKTRLFSLCIWKTCPKRKKNIDNPT